MIAKSVFTLFYNKRSPSVIDCWLQLSNHHITLLCKDEVMTISGKDAKACTSRSTIDSKDSCSDAKSVHDMDGEHL